MAEEVTQVTEVKMKHDTEVKQQQEVNIGHSMEEEERDKAVAAAVTVVAASARRGVVTLCASVADIIRNNYKLQQQVKELEERLQAAETQNATLEDNSAKIHCQEYTSAKIHCQEYNRTTNECQEYSSANIQCQEYNRTTNECQEYSSAKIQCQEYNRPNIEGQEYSSAKIQCQENSTTSSDKYSTTNSDKSSSTNIDEYSSVTSSQCPDSLPESPTSQRCGSAPPHFPQGSLRVCGGGGCGGAGVRKASDPGCGVAFLRSHTRASTGNLTGRSSNVAPFMRRKYSSISLRRVRRTTTTTSKGEAATLGSKGSNTSALQHNNNNNTNTKSCVVTVAEVYPDPHNNNNNTEGDAVKLLAQKLTSVLHEDSTQHHPHETQQEEEGGVLCAPHPLAGCVCVLCLDLATDTHTLPYEIVSDEGSLPPPGSTVLVTGRRVGTVVYFGHQKDPGRGTPTPSTPLLPPLTPDTHAGWGEGSPASPLGVMIQLWPPDDGEVFVLLNDVICKLDEDGDLKEPTTYNNNNNNNIETTSTTSTEHDIQTTAETTDLNHVIPDPHDLTRPNLTQHDLTQTTWRSGDQYSGTETKDRTDHYRDRNYSSVSNTSSSYSSLNTGNNASKSVEMNGTKSPFPRFKFTGTHERCQTYDNDSCQTYDEKTCQTYDEKTCQTYDEVYSDPNKLQLSDTWDSGCYMSFGRQSSECSDLESEFGSAAQHWAGGLEEALNSVWRKHKGQRVHSGTQDLLPRQLKRTPSHSFVLDSEV